MGNKAKEHPERFPKLENLIFYCVNSYVDGFFTDEDFDRNVGLI